MCAEMQVGNCYRYLNVSESDTFRLVVTIARTYFSVQILNVPTTTGAPLLGVMMIMMMMTTMMMAMTRAATIDDVLVTAVVCSGNALPGA